MRIILREEFLIKKYLKVDGNGTCMGFEEILEVIYDENLDNNIVDDKIEVIIDNRYSKFCCSQCFPDVTEICEEEALKEGIDDEITINR